MPRTPGERIGTGEQHYVYRASYPIGSTRLSKEEVEDIVRDMGKSASDPLYATGDAFHLGAPQTRISRVGDPRSTCLLNHSIVVLALALVVRRENHVPRVPIPHSSAELQ